MAHLHSGLAGLIHCTAISDGSVQRGFELAARRGLIHTRSAVGGTSTTSLEDIGHGIGDAFFESFSHRPGVYDTIAQRSGRARFNVRTFIPTTTPAAEKTPEGVAVRVSKVALNAERLEPVRVAAMVVATNESLQTPEGAASVEAELRGAVTLATDAEFLSSLGAGAGFTDDLSGDTLADIRTLCDAVSLTGFADLVLVASPEIANAMATNPVDFPDMRPTGGMAAGVDVLVSAGCPGLMLIDCTAILTGDQSFTLRHSTSATIEMDDDPAQDAGTPTGPGPTGVVVSCFQVNATAVMAERSFAALTVRASGVALLTPGTS